MGSNRKQFQKHKLSKMKEYGMYSDVFRDDMIALTQWLINNHYILKTKDKYLESV